MKIGFIGCGNMATAIINGILNNSLVEAQDIFANDTYAPAMEKVAALGVKADTADNVIKSSDIVFLAVKPNVIREVISQINDNSPLFISIAAGKTIEYLEDSASINGLRFVRVMPNINAKVGEAISAYCYNSLATDEDKSNVEKILNCFGKCLYIEEEKFSIYSAIGGCAPAFAYMFIDELARAGVKNGLTKAQALKIAAQTVYGSAKMILEGDEHPYKLIDNVCSPGGTTIEGVLSLQHDGFNDAIHNAVQKSYDKDKNL